MTAEDDLRRRLQALADKTRGPMRVYGRGKAETRRFVHDRRAGRHAWASTHEHAVAGLAVLARGEEDKAATFLSAAERFYISALELADGTGHLRLRLDASAGRGGRPPSPEIIDRNRRLAAAVAVRLDANPALKLWPAIHAAVASDPDLTAVFADAPRSTIEAAYLTGKNILPRKRGGEF